MTQIETPPSVKNRKNYFWIIMPILFGVSFAIFWVTDDNQEVKNKQHFESTDEYEICKKTFEGNASLAEIELMMNEILIRHHKKLNKTNVLHFGNALIAMRKENKKRITEIDILNYMYRNPSDNSDLGESIGLAVTILELRK